MTIWTCWRYPSHETTTDPMFGWPRCAECSAGPPYYERTAPADLRLDVVVPKGGRIKKGSAVVAALDPEAPRRYLIYFEGWLHGADQYAHLDRRGQYEAGLLHAAERMVTRYPTSAKAEVSTGDMLKIGTYTPVTRWFDVLDEDTLDRWLIESSPRLKPLLHGTDRHRTDEDRETPDDPSVRTSPTGRHHDGTCGSPPPAQRRDRRRGHAVAR